MESWLSWSLLAFITWGLWALFPKLSTNFIDPKSALFYETIGAAVTGFLILYSQGLRVQTHPKGIIFALLTGIAAVAGAWFYVNAAALGKISQVVTITALYPAVTIVLAFLLLSEPISLRQWAGVGSAMVAIYLVAS